MAFNTYHLIIKESYLQDQIQLKLKSFCFTSHCGELRKKKARSKKRVFILSVEAAHPLTADHFILGSSIRFQSQAEVLASSKRNMDRFLA